MSDDITPIRKQYLDIKRQHPDAIVFFRLGDFYETFDKDAEITSRELDIVLTSRNVAKGQRIPMAGIPFHAVDNYLARLIDKGYHVAICEQIGEPPAKGLVARKVVRVVTPGTIYEPELLRGHQNNYLASFITENDNASVSYVDITTGEFMTTEIKQGNVINKVRDELNRLKPAEILFVEKSTLPIGLQSNTTALPIWKFEDKNCEEILKKQFHVSTLDGFGLRGASLSIRTAGAILLYLNETQPASVKLLTGLSTYTTNDFMTLDTSTFRNLEIIETLRNGKIEGSLFSVIKKTITPMGERLLRQWLSQPLLDVEKIKRRQVNVNFFIDHGLLRSEMREKFKSIGDLERLTSRIIAGVAMPRELSSLRNILKMIPVIKEIFLQDVPKPLQENLKQIHCCDEVLLLIQTAIVDDPPTSLQKTGIIKLGYSSELDQVVLSTRHAREWISNLENVERNRTGIKNLKVGYNKVFGYYLEITHSHTNVVPANYIRKQTLVNAERYITPEMKEYEALVLNAEDHIHEIEGNLFRQVCYQISKFGNYLLETSRNIAQLDVLSSFAETTVLNGYVCPEITNDNIIDIIDGRHPVVEHTLREQRYVPNDAVLEPGEIIRIITGPNMSGKSTFLRQVAMIILMAQIGSYVPAKSAKIGLVDRIFTRIGAQDEIHAGQSTFMVEMVETANILHNATSRSLLVLDEIGRGTSTYDGVSIAWAVVEYIHNHPKLKSRTFFATHYHELMQLSQILPGVRNYNVAVSESEGNVVFLHKIVPGGSDRSYGIHVGELAGLPPSVVRRAAEILKNLEATSGKTTGFDAIPATQLDLFPETNPLRDEMKQLDINEITPIQALNILYDWKKRFSKNDNL